MLLELVNKSNKFQELSSMLSKPGQIIHGLTNSTKSFLLSSHLETSNQPIIFITQTSSESQVYHQEISNLSSKPVHLFQCQEISPYDQINSDLAIVSKQLEIFEAWASGMPSLTVVPFKSFAQLYMNKELLETESFIFDKTSSTDPDNLASKLLDLGYRKESTVQNRAEFSQRGDIFDIYPMVGEPVRIEFFGDEIESIRTFSVNTQRSIKECLAFKIHPRYLIVRNAEDGLKEKLLELYDDQISNLRKEAKDSLKALEESEIESAETSLYWEGVEFYRDILGQGSSKLTEYLPAKCQLIIDEWQDLLIRQKEWEDQLLSQYEDSIKAGKVVRLAKSLHLSLPEIKKCLEPNIQKLYLQTMSEETDDASLSYEILSYPGERFASKVEIFIEYIRKSLHEAQKIIIYSEQPQRVIGILKEWDIPSLYLEKGIEIPDEENLVFVQRDGTEEGFKLPDLNLIVLTDRELFGRSRQAVAKQKRTGEQPASRKDAYSDISQLKAGDYVVHYKHGVGKFQGAEFLDLENNAYKAKREYLNIEYADESRLLIPVDQVNLLSRYRVTGDRSPRLSKLGGSEWDRTKKKVKKSVKKIAEDLVKLYAQRAKQKGYKYPPDTPWQIEMEDSFPYSETPDQLKAIAEIKNDMETEKLLDRLICGDAGFGKTEVVLRSVFKAVMDGKQVAILVPTTVLAQQHFNVFADRFAAYPVRLGMLSRFRSAKEQKDVVERLKLGECDIVIGTHRLLQKDIVFKNLGLLVIDEEQRFGVSHKEKLKARRIDIDVITMSATPIPRTLHMALAGAKDISLISTPPVNRLPVKTFVGGYKPSIVRNAILHELERDGQIFFLHNRVDDIETVAHELQELVPEASIGVAHGQMNDRELEDIMFKFINHEFQILVCTTIIETGLDISNANTIILDRADTMGLSQLYQLRGRVGRSDVQAYAYFLCKGGEEGISETARQRLKAIRELTNLGSGYQVALRDMEIRGVGNILGAEQHGHMISVGFDLYCKLLDDSIKEIKEGIPESELQNDISVDINISAFFPENWIADKSHRMNEYKRLAEVRDEDSLNYLINEWQDRFGRLPLETQNLIEVVRVKLLAKQAGLLGVSQESSGIKLMVRNMRLQTWMPIQRSLNDYLQRNTFFKSGMAGGKTTQPFILIKTDGLSPDEQMESLKEVIMKLIGAKHATNRA